MTGAPFRFFLPDRPMTASAPPALEVRNLNALLISAWSRNGPREVMDDGSEVVSYHTLMRRVMALSCFIDELAGEARGPVLLYLPSGLWAVRCMLASWMTGRAALPIEAVAEAHRGPEHAPGRFIEPHRPHLERLGERPSLIMTLAPLARLADNLIRRSGFEASPVLYANDISRMMDIGHQEKIRSRLQRDWLDARAALDGSLPALLTEAGAWEGDERRIERRRHTDLLREIRAHLERLAPAEPSRFLCMTSIAKPSTWTCSTLPCLAGGGRMSFIRFFHPRHVLNVIQRDRIDHLWMTPEQYAAFAPTLAGTRLEWPVQYWCDAVPPEATADAIQRAAGASLRWMDHGRT